MSAVIPPQYMLRAPLSLEKMTYEARSGMVIYRSRMHKGLKRNVQLMPGAQWLELLCRHIPDRFEHLVSYVGWYSNRVRARRAAAGAAAPVAQEPEPAQEIAIRARSSLARLIKILKYLGLWAPRQIERAPPAGIEAVLPADHVLTYHPVPDIA